MNLNTTPFTEEEKDKAYSVFTFNESSINITLLNEISNSKGKLASGNNYSFGVIKNGEYFWYFNGTAVAKNRDKMREIFSALKELNKGTKNIPFTFKHKR